MWGCGVTCVGERGSAESKPGTGSPEAGSRAAGTATPAAAHAWRRRGDAPPGGGGGSQTTKIYMYFWMRKNPVKTLGVDKFKVIYKRQIVPFRRVTLTASSVLSAASSLHAGLLSFTFIRERQTWELRDTLRLASGATGVLSSLSYKAWLREEEEEEKEGLLSVLLNKQTSNEPTT